MTILPVEPSWPLLLIQCVGIAAGMLFAGIVAWDVWEDWRNRQRRKRQR